MNQIFEEILWRIYYATDSGLPQYGRFILLNTAIKDLHSLAGKKLTSAIYDLKKQKLIDSKKDYEGSVLVSLSEKGRLRAINYGFRMLGRKKEEWDGNWRMVAFDIPDSHRKGRNALRYRLRMGNFYEFQKSLFIYPYDCQKEIDAFVKLFKLEKYVRFALINFIDNQDKLKFHFKIN